MKKILDQYLSLVKNIFPEKKANRPSLGIDIGSHSCKAIEIIPTGDTFTILNWAVEPIGISGAQAAVKKILEKINSPSESPSTAIAGQGTLIRYIDMPRMPLPDARKSFEIEADKYFPFAKEQIYTDCVIVDSNNKENKMSLLVAAAKKDIIDHRIQLLSGLGLQADYIGVNALALANVFNVVTRLPVPTKEAGSDVAKTNVTAILDIGDTISSLIIIKDNLPRFTRDVFIGGKDLNKSISNVLGISHPEAEKMKCDSKDQSEEVLNACDSVLTNLAAEVRLSFDYFVTEQNTQISKLYLTGGSSSLQGLPELLSKNLEIPVERWNLLSTLKILPSLNLSDINKNVRYLGVALGLAIYQND